MLILKQLLFALALVVAGGGSGAPQVHAADAPTPQAGVRPLLTNYHSFWDLPEADRQREHDIRFEADVLFYDPLWRVLWLENEGMPLYCNVGEATFPIQIGDRVLLECRAVPSGGFEPKDLHLTVLGRAGPRPPPPDVTGKPDELERFNERPVRLTGFVETQEEVDRWHIRLHMVGDGRVIVATVLVGEGDIIPQFAGESVALAGLLYLHKNADGSIANADLWVANFGAVRGLGPLARDPRFLVPVATGAQLRDAPDGATVLVQGVVRSTQRGRKVVLWDETDQITVLSSQSDPLEPGVVVAATGKLERHGPELLLHQALWRIVGEHPDETHPSKLRRAAQVLELGLDEAARRHPVELWGVVTWSDPVAPFFYVQDSTRGVCVRSPGPWQTRPPFLGTSVRVLGVTGVGSFAPLVEFERFVAEGTIRLPEPRPITYEQLQSGAEEGKRVELSGFVREVRREGRWAVLQLTAPTGEFTARLITTDTLSELNGAIVRLDAVCTAVADAQGQLTAIDLLVAARQDIVVEVPAVADPFSVDPVPLSALRRFGPLETPYRRIRTSGVATLVDSGRRIILQDGAVGLEVLCREPVAIRPGDPVEVVGFPGRQASRVILREASARRGATAPLIAIPTWSPESPLVPDWDNRLVRIEATLEGILVTGGEVQFFLKAGELHPLVRVAETSAGGLKEGSRVACTGVYRVRYDAFGRPEWFNLQLRGLNDIEVLQPPPRLTLAHSLAGLALVTLGGGAALLWVALLRRRVRVQTRQIRSQLENQARLEGELQKAAKLESLGLLAGGIAHDFNNLLTVILGNLTLARLDDQVEAAAGDCLGDAERGAQRARDLTQQLLTFAKGGDPLRTAVSLSEVVREATEFVLRGSKVACDFDFAPGLRVADVDRGQIGQVVHNLVLNAVQAMPDGGTMRIALRNTEVTATSALPLTPGWYLELTVADTGAGMSPEVLSRIFDPYYTTKKAGNGLGLATVHSIIRRHHGHIDVRSKRGHGTTFHLWLPASASTVPEVDSTVHHALPAVVAGRRVLTMDDEEDIRRLVTTLLHRMGLEVVSTTDGSEAVEAYRAALAAGQPFDLVIMDLTVPGGLGGKDAMDALLALDPSVRAIVSSGYSNDPVLADFRAFGFRGMVRKPYEIEKLATCIAEVLGEQHPSPPDPPIR